MSINALDTISRFLVEEERVSFFGAATTKKAQQNRLFLDRELPFPPASKGERMGNFPQKLGENRGKVFAARSCAFRLQGGRSTGVPRSQPDSPLCDCDYLDACTGNCLEPVGIPEDDLSLHAVHRAVWPQVCEVRS